MGRPQRESNSITKTLADRLSDLMETEKQRTGLKQEEICKKIGVASGSYSEWASDSKTPTVDKVALVASYFEVSVDWLLGLTDVRSADPNIKEFSKITGLSEQCIENLKIIHGTDQAATSDGTIRYEFSETINFLVENEPQFHPIVWIGRYLSVPKIKESDYYVSVRGDIKQRQSQKDFEMDEFMPIDSSLLESALLERATSELFLLKEELNKSDFS